MPSPRPCTCLVAAALGAVACASASRGLPAPASATRSQPAAPAALADEGLSLAALDDRASLARAGELFQAALRADPSFHRARADEALLGLLVASAQRDEAADLASPEGDVMRASARELRERALDRLRPLAREQARDPAVLRALAVYYGLEGNTAQCAPLVAEARARAGDDPWIDFAELVASLRDAAPDAAIPRLQAFVASHPALLRARAMLARAQVQRGDLELALATLDDLLAANPRHDAALALKARLLSPPPARVAAIPAPHGAPPPQAPGYLPRKRPSGSPTSPGQLRSPALPAR